MLPLLGVLLGLAVGSYLDVVVSRVPCGGPVLSSPRTRPECGHRIRAVDAVPVFSWIALRGRCRDCGAPVPKRYPAVEAGTAVLFGLVVWRVGLRWSLPALLYLAAVAVALALIDLAVRRLPDAIVLPSYVVGLVLLALASWNPGGPSDWPALTRAAVGGAVMYVVYFVLVLVYPKGMGFGDVKLAGVLGMYLGWAGWGALVVGWFSGFLLGGVFSLVLVVARRAGRGTAIPFGPWMLLGAGVGLAWGEQISGWYLGMLV